MAPEVLDCPPKPLRLIGPGAPARGQEAADSWAANKGYTNKVDCWSVGVLAYELLLGVSPFAGVSASARGKCLSQGGVLQPGGSASARGESLSQGGCSCLVVRPSLVRLYWRSDARGPK